MIKKRVLCFLIKLSYWITNKALMAFAKMLFPHRLNYRDINKILVFRIGSLGDNIVILPIIKSLKESFPSARIDIMTDSGSNKKLVTIKDIIDKDLVDKIIFYREFSYKSLIKMLREEKYDLYIELPENLWSFKTLLKHMIFAKLIGVKYGIGWYKSVNKFLRKHQEDCVKFVNETERLFNILEKYGLILNRKFEFPFKFDKSIKNRVINLINEKNLHNKDKNVAFVIGAKREANRWPIENFAKVANFLTGRGYNVIIIGGKEDKILAQKLKSMCKSSKVYDFTGLLKPLESIYLFKFIKFTITNDTGPMHMSYSVDTPVLVLYCSWQYDGMWHPVGDKNIVISKKVDCSPCFKPVCSENICMQNISADEVINIIEEKFVR